MNGDDTSITAKFNIAKLPATDGSWGRLFEQRAGIPMYQSECMDFTYDHSFIFGFTIRRRGGLSRAELRWHRHSAPFS